MAPSEEERVRLFEEARERLDRWHVRERDLDPPLGLWAIVPLVPGTPSPPPVGTVPLLPLSDANGPTGLTEVGWHLHPQHQGQGFATEAADALLAAAATAGIGEVLALTDLDNVRSQAVAIRLGMSDEGRTSGRERRGQVSSCRRSRQNSLPSGSARTCHPSSPR